MAGNVTLDELAEGVVMACVGGQATLAHDQESIRGGMLQDVDGDTALAELFFLRTSVAFYALQRFFIKPAQEQLRDASSRCIHKILRSSGDKRIQKNPNAFIDGMNQRYNQYIEAIETPHELGPGWNVGSVFAKVCGQEKDIQVVWAGLVEFGGCMVAIPAFLTSAKNLDSGDIIDKTAAQHFTERKDGLISTD
jgi:hypothetical protein